MLIDVKFVPGDYVRFKKKLNKVHNTKCGFCGATGSVIGLDGTTCECPMCDGRGYTRETGPEVMTVIGPVREAYIDFSHKVPTVKYKVGHWGLSSFEVFQEEMEKIENPEVKETVVLRPTGERYWWSDWCDSYA